MKKIIISAILLAAASIGAVYFKSTHIYMNKNFYSKDEKEMWVFAEDKDFSTKKLNQFTELETLNVENVNDDTFEDFGDFKELSHIFFINSELYTSTSKLNSYEKLEYAQFDDSEVDLKGVCLPNLTDISFQNCNVYNISALKECAKLENISLEKTLVYDSIFRVDNKYVIKDSSVFADFDAVVNLDLDNIVVEDISGFLEMDALRSIGGLRKNSLSDEQAAELEAHGIKVYYR